MTKTANPGPIKSGRPRAKSSEGKPRFYETELYALLLKHLPQHVEGGRLNPRLIADAIGKNRYTVYRWLTDNFVSPKGATLLIEQAKGKLTGKDLAKFLLT